MKKTMIMSVRTGSYEKNWEKKNSYATIGRIFEKEDGTMFAKIDTLPINNDWDWMVSIFEQKPKEDKKDLPF